MTTTSITEDLDRIAELDRDMGSLLDRLDELSTAKADADRRVSEAVDALAARCEEDPAAGAREMRAAMAGREAEASRAIGRHANTLPTC